MASAMSGVTGSKSFTGNATDFASRRQKTHNTDFQPRVMHYPWHPWHGQSVVTRKATGPRTALVYWCSVSAVPAEGQFLEMPRWMFDPAACSSMCESKLAHVDGATLRELNGLIERQRAAWNESMLQRQPSCHTGQGDADVQEHEPNSDRAIASLSNPVYGPGLGEPARADAAGDCAIAGASDAIDAKQRSGTKRSRRGWRQ